MINTFVKDYKVGKSLCVKIREYFRYKQSQGSVYDYHGILSEMSPELRREVAVSTQMEWVEKLAFLKNASTLFMAEMVMRLQHTTFPSNETIIKVM